MMICANRLAAIKYAMSVASRLDGDIAEFGVHSGGSARVLAELKGSHQTLHLFDSFQGCPKPTADDGPNCREGTQESPYPAFVEAMSGMDYLVYVGWFSNRIRELTKPLAFVHVDCDQQDGVKLLLN